MSQFETYYDVLGIMDDMAYDEFNYSADEFLPDTADEDTAIRRLATDLSNAQHKVNNLRNSFRRELGLLASEE